MDIIKDIEKLDVTYLESFAKKIETPWGFLFLNENNPNYYDANHAHIRNIPNNPKEIIEEVVHFFKEKEIIPRFYIYNIENHQELIKELKSAHFQVEEFLDPIQLWDNNLKENSIDNEISIELVNDKNFDDALNIECSIKEFGGREVKEKAFIEEFNNSNFTHFLLSYKGIPCSTACIFLNENQARLESVATLNEFRGKGLIGKLIYYIQNYIKEKCIEKLWVFPINERVEKVYNKYGFETIGKIKTGHAFLGGKSVKEIQRE